MLFINKLFNSIACLLSFTNLQLVIPGRTWILLYLGRTVYKRLWACLALYVSVVAMFTVPYESSDFLSDEEIPPDYPAEIPPLLNEEDENMNFDWKGIMSNLKTYCTFSALKQYISRTTLPEVRPIIKYLVEENDVVDSIAAKFFPRDGPKGYIPIETMGDGNCSYRALAHVWLSDEGRYQEVWAHITFEAILKENSFLMHDILARGDLEGSENRPGLLRLTDA